MTLMRGNLFPFVGERRGGERGIIDIRREKIRAAEIRERRVDNST